MAESLREFARSIKPPVDAKRLGASVVQARERLRAIDGQVPVIIDDARSQDSIEISVEMEVDSQANPPSRAFRAELSDPFEPNS
jgi:hypothetical protein